MPMRKQGAIGRRTVLAGLAAMAAAGCAGRPRSASGSFYPWPLGVQLWSVFTEPEERFAQTLDRLAATGFERVEAAGWMGRSPAEFARMVRAAGLECDSAHVSMPDLAADMPRRIGEARDAGCDYLFCASPQPPAPLVPGSDWMSDLARAMTRDAWRRNADLLSEAGALAAQAGLKFGYHNHSAEFASYDGEIGYEVLLADADPALVLLELDVAWALAGGADPVALLRRLGKRVARLHLKDLVHQPVPGRMMSDFATVPVGQGVIDWAPILAAARAAGVSGAYLEAEPPHARSPFDELADSVAFIEKL